jgi:hypothetical protein
VDVDAVDTVLMRALSSHQRQVWEIGNRHT